MFRDIAERFNLSIEKADNAPIELLMEMPKQQGLDFPITLGLQNGDELNIGVNAFWSYFFPFEEKKALVEQSISDLIRGKMWIEHHHQFGRITKSQLVSGVNGKRKVLYTSQKALHFPFLPRKKTKIQNAAMKSI